MVKSEADQWITNISFILPYFILLFIYMYIYIDESK